MESNQYPLVVRRFSLTTIEILQLTFQAGKGLVLGMSA